MDDALNFGFYLHRAAYLVDQLTRHSLEQVRLSLTQFLVLDLIADADRPHNQQMLAFKLVISKGAISKQIDILEGLKLVKRVAVPNNRKDHHIVLTAKGTEKLSQARHVLAQSGIPIQAAFSNRDFKELVAALHKVCLTLDPSEQVY